MKSTLFLWYSLRTRSLIEQDDFSDWPSRERYETEMISCTLSKAQQAARDYAHQVALEEMRPIALECDRTEKIPESFFWNMQKRYWAGAAGQARQQDTGEEEQIGRAHV